MRACSNPAHMPNWAHTKLRQGHSLFAAEPEPGGRGRPGGYDGRPFSERWDWSPGGGSALFGRCGEQGMTLAQVNGSFSSSFPRKRESRNFWWKWIPDFAPLPRPGTEDVDADRIGRRADGLASRGEPGRSVRVGRGRRRGRSPGRARPAIRNDRACRVKPALSRLDPSEAEVCGITGRQAESDPAYRTNSWMTSTRNTSIIHSIICIIQNKGPCARTLPFNLEFYS